MKPKGDGGTKRQRKPPSHKKAPAKRQRKLVNPRAILEAIAQDKRVAATARVAACKALIALDRPPPAPPAPPPPEPHHDDVDALSSRALAIMNRRPH